MAVWIVWWTRSWTIVSGNVRIKRTFGGFCRRTFPICPGSTETKGRKRERQRGRSGQRWREKSCEERERRSDRMWGRGVKENRVVCRLEGNIRKNQRRRENRPRIIKRSKHLALKFCLQHFHSLDLRLYCWVAEDDRTLCAYSAVFCCRLPSDQHTSDVCCWYMCFIKKKKVMGVQIHLLLGCRREPECSASIIYFTVNKTSENIEKTPKQFR